MNSRTGGVVVSPTHPFLSLLTDDKKKQLHHESLTELLLILKNAGMKIYNVSHIDDPERSPEIPIKIGSHLFDISFPRDKNTIILIELKILKLPPAKDTK